MLLFFSWISSLIRLWKNLWKNCLTRKKNNSQVLSNVIVNASNKSCTCINQLFLNNIFMLNDFSDADADNNSVWLLVIFILFFTDNTYINFCKHHLHKFCNVVDLCYTHCTDLIQHLQVCLKEEDDFMNLCIDRNYWIWFKNKIKSQKIQNVLFFY